MTPKRPGSLIGIRSALKTYQRNCFAEGLLFSMAWTMHVVFHIKTVHFDNFMVVFMGTLYEVAIMCFEVPTGVVADLVSRRLSASIGWFILGLGFFIEGLFPVAWVVICAQLLLGFGETFVSGAHDAWVADELPHTDPGIDSGTAFLKGQQSSFIGRMIGAWIAVLFTLISLPAVMIASGTGFMLFSLFAFRKMSEKGFHKSDEQRHFWATFREGYKLVQGSKVLILILAVSVFYGLASEGFDRLWNKAIMDLNQLPPVGSFGTDFWWPVFSTLAILGGMAVNKLVRQRVDTGSSQAVSGALLVMTTALICTIAGFALAPSIWIGGGLFVVSRALRRGIEPLVKTWLNLHAPSENRATLLSFGGQAHSLGEIAGGPLVGSIGKLRAAKDAIFVASLLLLPTLPLLVKGKAQQTGEPKQT